MHAGRGWGAGQQMRAGGHEDDEACGERDQVDGAACEAGTVEGYAKRRRNQQRGDRPEHQDRRHPSQRLPVSRRSPACLDQPELDYADASVGLAAWRSPYQGVEATLMRRSGPYHDSGQRVSLAKSAGIGASASIASEAARTALIQSHAAPSRRPPAPPASSRSRRRAMLEELHAPRGHVGLLPVGEALRDAPARLGLDRIDARLCLQLRLLGQHRIERRLARGRGPASAGSRNRPAPS